MTKQQEYLLAAVGAALYLGAHFVLPTWGIAFLH